MDDYWTITNGICETCGTEVLRDEDSGAEVHRDPTYDACGVEGELAPLVEHIYGPRTRRPHLRLA